MEENPLVEPERPKRQKKSRHLTAWEAQSQTWHGPAQAFTCCGTIYRAMNQQILDMMKRAHQEQRHG